MRQYEIQENFYQKLVDKKSEILISLAGVVSDYFILYPAYSSFDPVSPKGTVLWIVAIGGSLFLGLIIIGTRYFLHSTIISLDEIKKKSKATILGLVPTVDSNTPVSSIVINNNPKSVVSEAFRSIRSSIGFISPYLDESKSIAITSTISGEGKTFIAINLAAILSMLNKKVIVVDMDMRRPKLNYIFNIENTRGMSTILIGRDPLDACIYKTAIPNLDYITSGPIPPNPAELVLSSNMKQVFMSLKEKYDFIVYDTPPVGLVTDGVEILKNVDLPIYIFRADYSDKNFIPNVDRLIDEHGIQNLSVVLNDVGRGVSGYYYTYGGGYAYGYAYSYGYGYGYGGGSYYSDKPYVVSDRPKRK